MKTRSVTETAILSASVLIALIVVVVGAKNAHGKSAVVLVALCLVAGTVMVLWSRQNSRASTAKTELTSSEECRRLAEECRRLAEMAVTAQEHTDLRLGEVSVQMDQMRAQLASVQKILSEVE